jgi:hypothetical protein
VVAGLALGLVGRDQHRLVPLAQDLGEDPVQRRQALAGVEHQQGDVGLLDRQLGLGAHPRLQALVGDVLEAGGVDQLQVQVAQAAVGEAAVAGDAGLVVDQGQLAAGQTVEQGRLAHIGAADDGEFQRHGL